MKRFSYPIFIYLITVFFVLNSCAPARFVKPLEKNQSAVNLSFGGPLIEYGNAVITVPFATATYGYGLDSTLTVFTSLNLTSALYGNVQLEFGALKQLLKQKNYFPALSVGTVLNIIYRDPRNKKLYPQLDLIGFWEYGKHDNFFYVGVDNWFELSKKRGLDQDQLHNWFFTPMLGHTFNSDKWNFNIEAKLIAPYISNRSMVVDYLSPVKDKGAFGIYFGYTRKF